MVKCKCTSVAFEMGATKTLDWTHYSTHYIFPASLGMPAVQYLVYTRRWTFWPLNHEDLLQGLNRGKVPQQAGSTQAPHQRPRHL